MTLEETKLDTWLALRKGNTLIHRILSATSTGDLDDTIMSLIPAMESLATELPTIIERMEQDPLIAEAKEALRL